MALPNYYTPFSGSPNNDTFGGAAVQPGALEDSWGGFGTKKYADYGAGDGAGAGGGGYNFDPVFSPDGRRIPVPQGASFGVPFSKVSPQLNASADPFSTNGAGADMGTRSAADPSGTSSTPDSFSAPYTNGFNFSAQSYNPSQYATLDTAANYANWLGASVNQTVPVGPIAPPPQYGLQFGTGMNGNNGETLNAGLVANSWEKAQGLYNDPAVALKQFNGQRAAELAYSHTPYTPTTAIQIPAQNGQPANYGGPPASTGQVPNWNVYDPSRPTTVANPNPQAVAYPKTGGNPYSPTYTPPPAGTPFDPAFPNYTPYGGNTPRNPAAGGGQVTGAPTGFLGGVSNGMYTGGSGAAGGGGNTGGSSADGWLANFANNTGYLENYAKNAGYQAPDSIFSALNGVTGRNPYIDAIHGVNTTNTAAQGMYGVPITNAYTDTLNGAAGTGFGVDTSGYAINGRNTDWNALNQYNAPVAQIGRTGDPIDQLPAWEAMKAAQERNIRQRGADLQEKFNVMGGRFSTAFGSAYGDYQNQAALDQNAQLTAAVTQAAEAAAGRKLQANTFLSGQEQARLNARASDVTQRDTTAGQLNASMADAAAQRRLAAGSQLGQIGTAETGYALDKAKAIGNFGYQDITAALQKAGMMGDQGAAEAALNADLAKSRSGLALQADSAARDRELQAADALAKMGFAGAGQLSAQDFQAWQQEQQAAAAAAQAAAQGSDAASRSIADTAAAAGNAMYGTSVDAAKALYGNEIAAANAMFNAQNQSYQNLMQYDPSIRQIGTQAATNLSTQLTNNLNTGAALGAQQFGVDSFNLDRLFQEYLRRQPENSPLLPYLAALSTAQPVMYQPQYKPSAFAEYAGAISGLVNAGANVAKAV